MLDSITNTKTPYHASYPAEGMTPPFTMRDDEIDTNNMLTNSIKKPSAVIVLMSNHRFSHSPHSNLLFPALRYLHSFHQNFFAS